MAGTSPNSHEPRWVALQPTPSVAALNARKKGVVVTKVTERRPVAKLTCAADWEREEWVEECVRPGIAQIGAVTSRLLQRRRPLPVVLDALCRLFDAAVGECFSAVLLIDRGRASVARAIGPGLPPGYGEFLEGQTLRCDAATSGIPTSRTTQARTLDLLSLLGQWNRAWLASAPTRDLGWLGSSPILSLTGELVGIFVAYRRDAGSPKPCTPALLEHFSNMAGIAIDRSRTEEAFKRTEAQLAKTQQLSSTGSFSWRPATDEILWSEELYRIFELDPGVPVTLDLIRARVHPEAEALFRELTERVRRGGNFECEHTLRLSEHSVKYVRVVAHETRDREGLLEYIGVVQDVTPRRLCDEALGKVRAELSHVTRVSGLAALTASIAHEVNQPLSGIVINASACLSMLDAGPPDLEGARETARRTIRDGQRASDIIAKLRALFCKKSALTESVDLNSSTREVIALLSSEMQRAGVTVRVELAEDLPLVTGDRAQLQQVVLNLLLNASEAMECSDGHPKHLTVKTEQDSEGGVRLSVRDEGIGLPQDSARLFQAFHSTKSGGMGIGLSISRSIIESHRGRIWAGPNDGPGATFSFCIPQASERERYAQNPGQRTPAATAAKRGAPRLRDRRSDVPRTRR